jgi:hypothetical protein
VPAKGDEGMKVTTIALGLVGLCLVLAGGLWFMQGMNLLPGSYMTGRVDWAIYGGVAFAAGIGLFIWLYRRARSATKPETAGAATDTASAPGSVAKNRDGKDSK